MIRSPKSLIRLSVISAIAGFLMWYLLWGMIGCDGSGEPAYTPLPDQDPTGIWDGLYFNTDSGFWSIKAIIYKNHWVFFDDESMYDPIAPSGLSQGDNIQISSNLFKGDFERYIWESYSYTAPYDGEVYTRDSIYGINNDNRHISFRLDQYLAISDNSASLLLLNGNWNFSRGSSFSLDVSMDEFGGFAGADSDGCFYDGNVSVPDPQRNIYQIAITKSSCDEKNGNYTGLGYVWGETFTYAISNGKYSMYGKLVRI